VDSPRHGTDEFSGVEETMMPLVSGSSDSYYRESATILSTFSTGTTPKTTPPPPSPPSLSQGGIRLSANPPYGLTGSLVIGHKTLLSAVRKPFQGEAYERELIRGMLLPYSRD
jgi:hypothetical protein